MGVDQRSKFNKVSKDALYYRIGVFKESGFDIYGGYAIANPATAGATGMNC
jgi:hypothetical protein